MMKVSIIFMPFPYPRSDRQANEKPSVSKLPHHVAVKEDHVAQIIADFPKPDRSAAVRQRDPPARSGGHCPECFAMGATLGRPAAGLVVQDRRPPGSRSAIRRPGLPDRLLRRGLETGQSTRPVSRTGPLPRRCCRDTPGQQEHKKESPCVAVLLHGGSRGQ